MRILVISSSRADFGLLIPVIHELNHDETFQVKVCEIGSHISKDSSNFQTLESTGISSLALSIKPLLEDSRSNKAQIASMIISDLTEYFKFNRPDAILILGDRYETLAIAYTATLSNIPIIHLVGGDLTLGSIDDSYRHAITKLSSIHFVTNQKSYSRVLQMGENPDCVFVTGSPGLDILEDLELAEKHELEQEMSVNFKKQIILVTFHPDSMNPTQTESQVSELISALKVFCKNSTIILTGSNYDTGYSTINRMFQDFAEKDSKSVRFFDSLGTKNYMSLMKIASVMVGNSSSGYYEAPTFSLPVVDLGERQKGRIPHLSLVNVPIKDDQIIEAIEKALSAIPSIIPNPYWTGKASVKIKEVLKSIQPQQLSSTKDFVTKRQGELN